MNVVKTTFLPDGVVTVKGKMNIIFLGGFAFPYGMAGTRRIMNAIDGLRIFPDVSMRVVVLRQSSKQNTPDGVHNGIPYQTVVSDVAGAKMLFMTPVLQIKARRIIKELYRQGQHNILYVYSPPSYDNLPIIRFARRIGFKVVFDIVEDDELARVISRSLLHRLKVAYNCRASRNIASIADGIVVISSHLENKFRTTTSNAVPIHKLPISVDMNCYPEGRRHFGDPVTLFYAGSFGMKDGIGFLLDAFDKLAAKREDIQLALTGIGADDAMRELFKRIAASPHKDRILYKGYLDDASYYAALNSADILCMTRVDIGYAQAGFPFKLGEYLATGKPVIATAVSDIPNILRDRQDALLVAPGQSDAIAEAAEFYIADQESAFAIGARGRLLAQRLFDYRVQCEGLYEFISKIAS